MTENICSLQAELREINRQIEKQKLLDKLAQIPVCHRNMAKREAIETALKNL